MSDTKYLILTKAFWADTLERTLATAAQAVAATWGADVLYPNAFSLDYKVLAGVAAGGALAALVKQIAKLGLTAQVPTPIEPARKSGGDIELAPRSFAPAPMPQIDNLDPEALAALVKQVTPTPVGAGNDIDVQPIND